MFFHTEYETLKKKVPLRIKSMRGTQKSEMITINGSLV